MSRPSGPSATTSVVGLRRCSTTSFRQAKARESPNRNWLTDRNPGRAAAPGVLGGSACWGGNQSG
jgi:hypothetical protein